MVMHTITATQFKAKCLAILDDVAAGGEVVVTKHGRPVAKLVPVEDDPRRALVGSVRQLVSDEELIAPLEDEWELLPD